MTVYNISHIIRYLGETNNNCLCGTIYVQFHKMSRNLHVVLRTLILVAPLSIMNHNWQITVIDIGYDMSWSQTLKNSMILIYLNDMNMRCKTGTEPKDTHFCRFFHLHWQEKHTWNNWCVSYYACFDSICQDLHTHINYVDENHHTKGVWVKDTLNLHS